MTTRKVLYSSSRTSQYFGMPFTELPESLQVRLARIRGARSVANYTTPQPLTPLIRSRSIQKVS